MKSISYRVLPVLVLLIGLAAAPFQQDGAEPSSEKPTEQHQWLQQFVGKWDMQNKATMAQGQEPQECTGTMVGTDVGGFWIMNQLKGNMMGMEYTGFQTIGYDPKTEKFIGTWVDSSGSHMWKYEGSLDKTGKVLTLEAEGPDFADPEKKAMYQDIYEFVSKDEFRMLSKTQLADGKWVTFMSGGGKRIK